jgi:hypothetical protein
VLDDVERRRFLVQPAGEHALPPLVGALDVDLHERAGQFLFLPGGGGFACPQAHHQVLPPRRLARVQGNVADDAVALVEHAEDGDALRHWRNACLVAAGGSRAPRGRRRPVLLLPAAAARGEAQRKHQGKR